MSATIEPEVHHFIGLLDGFHATVILTARTEDGKITRTDGRGPWDPIYDGDAPVWFRVPAEVAEAWTADDDEVE